MNKIIRKICSDIIEEYKQDGNVLGIMLFGSAARGKFDKHSDIDIYILLKNKGEFSRVNFTRDGIQVDIILETTKEIKSFLEEDAAALKRITSQMIAGGVIIFQKGNIFKKIQSIAKNNLRLKTKYKDSEILMHKYSIDDFLGEVRRDIEKKDFLAFGLDSHFLMNNIIELFLKIKKEFLRQPNEMAAVLNKLDRKFYRLIESFYKSTSMGKKEKILSELVGYVYKKYSGSLPERWTIKN
ncbi:MAG: nucleotidyltransferase domain-containing protein [bacterium]|nr:nucleotidyltransferase domain-containing protein [bacterium]